MKVLFAVNNDDISNAIIKKYQKTYKQILSYKNVYYFNAILKELQKDKSYDRVVISEDLEPFANNNYDAIDKFLFEKLDKISDEATNEDGNDTDIILICTDRRSKSDEMLVKLFGIGIYNSIIGQDRSIDEVCKLINKPRTKKEAKLYYKIDSENVSYQAENEDSVSETEMQNILAHYARLGKNEDKYVDSFNNIVSQYTDSQLKIIIRYLPMGVKAVLEERSPKYQELAMQNGSKNAAEKPKLNQYNKLNAKKEPKYKIQMINDDTRKSKMDAPVVIPSEVSKKQIKRLMEQEEPEPVKEMLNTENMPNPEMTSDITNKENDAFDLEEVSNSLEENKKRGRGRPKKILTEEEIRNLNKPKRGRGRPKKILENADEDLLDIDAEDEKTNIDLFNLENDNKTDNTNDLNEEDMDLFNIGEDEEEQSQNNGEDEDIDLFNIDNSEENKEEKNEEDEIDLFNLDDDDDKDLINLRNRQEDTNTIDMQEDNDINDIVETHYKNISNDFSGLISKDKKIVSFVGTTKNGTSFIVNNVAHLLASRGIRTAVLDMTKTRNAYYIYTNSDDVLIKKAKECIGKLKRGIAEGISINKNLEIYTSIPEDDTDYSQVDLILGTLIKNYSVVLIDCDFDTPKEYFEAAQETYLVQSMDVLTIQPLTAFLRNLQSKGILRQEKLKVVINKSVNIKSVSIKTLIGGISKYNDPSMTYMKDLFDKDKINYCVIPFEIENYIKYLDAVITCKISLNGYTKSLMAALNELGNMIYPLISAPTYSPRGNKYKDDFSSDMNDTLNKMKKKYQ